MEIVLVLIVSVIVVYMLGLFRPVAEMAEIATRESSAYNREHKVKVIERYKTMKVDAAAVKKVNENIALIDAVQFD